MKITSLKNSKNFDRVFHHGQRFGNRHFQFYYLKNRKSTNRLGIIVSKKVSKRAVVRNKVKRRIRASYQNELEQIQQGYDLIIVAKKRCADDPYRDLDRSLRHLFYKTKLEKP
ncbi:ribonuclease P protein component [Pseudoramibacter porci]|uniref:Ribonuclease P protein component n=1 Tax=Pseudoramibacter porci TaxID=2606631 RepID=A0A7X2TAR5_9FIRM|nr:ribonuclease P protein component [Pseudoramibacter porci]